jgi:hypothetical protein
VLEENPIFLEDYRDLASLDPALFPLAERFAVVWIDDGLEFVDESLGIRVTFPWWERADVERWIRTVVGAPLGSVDEPFDDVDQGWHILIWRMTDEVFVLEGAEDTFPVRLRVPADLYLAEWAALAGRLERATGADS